MIDRELSPDTPCAICRIGLAGEFVAGICPVCGWDAEWTHIGVGAMPVDTFGRDAEAENMAKAYILAGLSAALPFTLLTRSKKDEAAIMRLITAVNDPTKWNNALDVLLGPKQ